MQFNSLIMTPRRTRVAERTMMSVIVGTAIMVVCLVALYTYLFDAGIIG